MNDWPTLGAVLSECPQPQESRNCCAVWLVNRGWIDTLCQTPFDDFSIERRLRLALSGFEACSALEGIAGTAIEFTKNGVEKMVVAEVGIVADFLQSAQPRLSAFDFRDNYSAVEQVDRRAVNG